MIDNNIKLRRLKDNKNDYKKLTEWYQNEIIYKSFEQRSLNYEQIKNKYLPRTYNNTKIPVYMIEYENNPIGIIQYQIINKNNQKLYNINSNNAYEIDIFIGDISYHNKGIGKKCLNLLTNYLFKEKAADIIIMCPLIDNYQAIKCYEKCKFKKINKFKAKNTIGVLQEYVLMIRKN